MRHDLPQLRNTTFLTDGGLETTLVFIDGIDLPDFASFPLLDSPSGVETLSRTYREYVSIAERDDRGIVLETPTWRANPDWGRRLGYSAGDLDRVNRDAVAFIRAIGAESSVDVVTSGNIGPRGDGYVVADAMSTASAADYHRRQIESFATAGADLVTVLTLNYIAEGIGIAQAAADVGMPSVIAFTVETDGLLPSGDSLGDAITAVDDATGGSPAYYMINCAHPTHFRHVLEGDGPWDRVRGIRANASTMSHEELDNAPELDRGDEVDLAAHYRDLHELLPNLAVVGGCCGTDHHHLDLISTAVPTAA